MTSERGERPSDNCVIWLHQIRQDLTRQAKMRQPVPPLCEFLQHGTRHAQQRRAGLLSRIELVQERYPDFLRGEAEALFSLEIAAKRSGIEDILPDWHDYTRSAALSRDLLALDIICDPLPVPHLEDQPELLGVCYALQTMRIGMRIILDALTLHGPSATITPTSYLRISLRNSSWRSFVEMLESHPEGRACPQRVLHAAQMTFGMFESAHGAAMCSGDIAFTSYSN